MEDRPSRPLQGEQPVGVQAQLNKKKIKKQNRATASNNSELPPKRNRPLANRQGKRVRRATKGPLYFSARDWKHREEGTMTNVQKICH